MYVNQLETVDDLPPSMDEMTVDSEEEGFLRQLQEAELSVYGEFVAKRVEEDGRCLRLYLFAPWPYRVVKSMAANILEICPEASFSVTLATNDLYLQCFVESGEVAEVIPDGEDEESSEGGDESSEGDEDDDDDDEAAGDE